MRFDDPATQITDSADLTAYVLPGMSGDGVQCVEGHLNTDEVLAMSVDSGSRTVTGTIVDCIRPTHLGNIIAMYAVGFRADAMALYPTVSRCATSALADQSPATMRADLEAILRARLDLPAPPTSPDVAANVLTSHTDCLSATTAVTTSTSEPEAPSAPTSDLPPATTTSGPLDDKTMKWDYLRAGQCIVDLPTGDFLQVTVTDCANLHGSEVVGSDLVITGTEESRCSELFVSYTGKNSADLPNYTVDVLVSTDTFANPQVICLASSLTPNQTTGSLATP